MKNKNNQNRSFGILFFIVFVLIGIWPILNGNSIRFWSIFIAIIFLTLGLLNSNILKPLRLVWIKLGEILGKIIAPIVMGIIYFIIVTPIGLFLKIIGKDLIKINFSKDNSYWIKREKNINSMKKQF